MKVKNKITGKLANLTLSSDEKHFLIIEDGETSSYTAKLADLEEWEDVPEKLECYWYIDDIGVIQIGNELSSVINMQKLIGNYFETKEEAEKAAEKLKAAKRLKDKGFRFSSYNACSVDYDINEQYRKYISNDLDLLFGGEE